MVRLTRINHQSIILNSDLPRPLAFDMFERFNILDKNVMEGPDAKSKANGTGPFKMANWSPNDKWEFVRNPNYFLPGLPHAETSATEHAAAAKPHRPRRARRLALCPDEVRDPCYGELPQSEPRSISAAAEG